MTMTVAMLAVGLGCVTAVATQPASAQHPGVKQSRDWKALPGTGLDVVGNAREGDLRRARREITAFRAALASLMPGIRLSAPEPTTLVVFKDHPSFTEFAPRDGKHRRQLNVGGYFSKSADRNYLVLPVHANRRTTSETALHEYTHFVISRNFRDVPLWLNEGLAEFYSTFEVNDQGHAIVGKAPSSRIDTLRSDRMPPLRHLLSGATIPRNFRSSDTAMFYAQSWLFVHYMTLADGGKRQGQIVKYLQLLPTTTSAEAAAREAFGTTLEALEHDVIRYSERDQFPALGLAGAASEAQPQETAAMNEADVAELKGRLLVELGVAREAAPYVERALALDPSHRAGQITQGRLLVLEERETEALAILVKVAQEDPGSFAAQYYLGSALYNGGRYQDAIVALDRALKISPKAASAWFAVALATMALRQYDQSDSAMAQVQELYSAADWHYARAHEALRLGRYDAALPEATTFIERAGVGDDSAPYAAFIGVIAARRLGLVERAEALLTRTASVLLPRSWPLTVVQFMQGRLNATEFLRKAQDNGQRTEANTYLGMHLAQIGQNDEAIKHLTWVKEKGERHYTEYALAIAELKRLQSGQ
ncbi:MAG: tetratricopeptide repeat protein [Acidobacteria bacterium]|nr:tetratricopeptide repeat protein [Acidobacteriota bacterium]